MPRRPSKILLPARLKQSFRAGKLRIFRQRIVYRCRCLTHRPVYRCRHASCRRSICFPTGTVHLSPKHHSGARLKVLQKLHVFASSPQNLQFSHRLQVSTISLSTRLQVSTISLSTEFWMFELGIRLEIGSKKFREGR